MSASAPVVLVSGLIGAGKTTLVNALAPRLGLVAKPEAFEANPYFERFYEAPKRWAFHSFVYFYEESIRNQASAVSVGGIVQERPPREHLEVFGVEFRRRRFLADDDWLVLSNLVRTTEPLLPAPELLVHIEIEPRVALTRLRKRARSVEASVDLHYLEALHARYADFLSNWDLSALLRVEAEDWDFRRDTDVQRLARHIETHVPRPAVAQDGGGS